MTVVPSNGVRVLSPDADGCVSAGAVAGAVEGAVAGDEVAARGGAACVEAAGDWCARIEALEAHRTTHAQPRDRFMHDSPAAACSIKSLRRFP
jgi:hypothetical protein